MINRRNFLFSTLAASIRTPVSAQTPSNSQLVLTIPEVATGAYVRPNFIGLSYEIQELTNPGFFSAKNVVLVKKFQQIASQGVLRLGGNTSEFAWWKETPSSVEPKHPPVRESYGEPKAQFYPVTPEAIVALKGFLDATGWTCIYGIPFGLNTPERASAQAKFVAETLGERLLAFQLGNEVDLYTRHLRDARSWTSSRYMAEWMPMARAIADRVPNAKFGLPDMSSNVQWLTEIARDWKSMEDRPKVLFLSHHYYFSGPATNPDVSAPNLLSPVAMQEVSKSAAVADAAARNMGIFVRMTEGNTCYGGGKPGVSDTFAASLWAADYVLLLAKNWYAGVNLHGGTGWTVANSVGGTLPGDTMLLEAGSSQQDVNLHPHPFYTPIAEFNARFQLEPTGMGLQFAAAACDGHLFEEDWSSQLLAARVNATAYGVKFDSHRKAVFLINKDLSKDADIVLDFGSERARQVKVEVLRAPSLESRVVEVFTSMDAVHHERRLPLTVRRSSAVRVSVVEV